MKVSLDARTWAEPRFESLRRLGKIGQAEALGTLVLLWHGTRTAGLEHLEGPGDLCRFLPLNQDEAAHLWKALLLSGYLQCKDSAYRIEGNAEALDILARRLAGARIGGELSKKAHRAGAKKVAIEAKVPEKAPAPTPSKKADTEGNKACWEAYREAFVSRYRTEPPRNAMVNANIAQFVKRVGRDEAPRVIRFYLTHNDPAYTRGMHQVKMAVKDAEALMTQCTLGRAITSGEVAAANREHLVRSQLGRIQAGEL